MARDALRPFSNRLRQRTFEELVLLVTELVSNSVRHAGLRRDQRIRIRVSLAGSTVRAEVREPGRGFKPELPPTPERAGGFGLFLVNRLANRWQVSEDGETAVSFELQA
jgi:two-component sensor histidine kinase